MGLKHLKTRLCPLAQLLTALNYLLPLVYGGFCFAAIQIDPFNQLYIAVTLILGSVNVATTCIGFVGILCRIDMAIRGTFTLLLLEHTIGFVLGWLLLSESLTNEPLTEYHHGAPFAVYFLQKSKALAIGLSVALIGSSVIGFFTLSYVAKWQTELEAARYLDDMKEVESLLAKSARKETDTLSAEETSTTPIVTTSDQIIDDESSELIKEGSFFIGAP